VPCAGGGARPGGYLFGGVALVRGDAAFEGRSAVEFLAEAVGEACGEEAPLGTRGGRRVKARESRGVRVEPHVWKFAIWLNPT